MTVVSDELVADVIERLVLIEKTIPLPRQTTRKLEAETYWWGAINVVQPTVFNKFSGGAMDDGSKMGKSYYADALRFTLRLDSGTIASGEINQREDDLNRLIYAMVNRFRQSPLLENPDPDGPTLRWVTMPGAHWEAIPQGVQMFTFDKGENQSPHMCCDFVLVVNVLTAVPRSR